MSSNPTFNLNNGTNVIKGLNPIVGDDKTKVEKKVNPVQFYIKFSFSITYIFLLTTATITFIEAMRTNIPTVRHVLNLETAVSLIAGYFYSVFMDKISTFEKEDRKINWKDFTDTRYIDWSMTTPLMLIVLSLTLAQNIGKQIHLEVILTIIVLNYIMLYLGYLAENNSIQRIYSFVFGFLAFFAMMFIIFISYVKPKYVLSNYVLFSIFTGIWSMYGLFFMLGEEYKHIGMNVLDCLSKCCFGLGLWAYFSKIIVL